MWIAAGVGLLVLVVIGLVIWARATAPSRFPMGSLAFEAELTMSPLMLTIEARNRERTGADPARRAELDREIAFLAKQVDEIQAIVDRGDRSPGRGYVGFDAYGATQSSWVAASRS